MKTLISFGQAFYRACAASHVRLYRARVLFGWWWMVRSRRCVVLRDLVIQVPGNVIHVGLIVVSTRGLFVVQTLDAEASPDAGFARRFERGRAVMSGYDDRMRQCEAQARQVAHMLEECVGFVSPVLVIPDAGALPADRPAHLVSGRGLVDYICRFRVDVFSSRRTQQIVSQLSASTTDPVRLAA